MTCIVVKDISPSANGGSAVHVKRRRSRIVPEEHGAKPTNLPVQVPVKFEMAVNVKTGKGACFSPRNLHWLSNRAPRSLDIVPSWRSWQPVSLVCANIDGCQGGCLLAPCSFAR